ncbi:hypothetical protein CLOM_g22667 [Closterium sp. NIES-68]|nr:hypothetical protein CLOM_g22667 [Closterium sp. NIES-68]GJP66502.1 hypothetical protein CLOP_g23429 [Closterium sp. NIES-67]
MARPGAKKRVNSEPTIMRRAPDGSAFLTCEACSTKVPVATADMHSCENDAAFKATLERLRLEFRERMAEEAAAKKQKAEKAKPAKGEKGEKAEKAKPGKGEKKGEKVEKRKAEKDPNAPKKPTTAYFLFLEDFRKQFKDENPDVKGVTEMSKAAGIKWKSLTDEEKEKYTKGAAERKKEYEAKMEEYNMQSRAEGVGETEDEDEETHEEESKPAKKKRLVSKQTKEDETLNEELQDDIAD